MTDDRQSAAGEAFGDQVKGAGEALRASGQRIADNSSSLGVAMIDQAQTNAQEAFVALRAAAQAKDLNDVMRIQSAYLREQSQRSMDQAREIGELIVKFGRDAVAPLQGGGSGS